jgi:hypothetical protein
MLRLIYFGVFTSTEIVIERDVVRMQGGCIQLQLYDDAETPERAITWDGTPPEGVLPLK